VKLDAARIQRVVNAGGASINQCFDKYKKDLPADEGQTNVTITVVSSGKVSQAEVSGSLAGTAVGKCLRERVSRLRFPAHTDQSVTFAQPFAYHVQRAD
jgi:hypothetical protein